MGDNLAALAVDEIRARHQRDSSHTHRAQKGDPTDGACGACRFGRMVTYLGDRQATWRDRVREMETDRGILLLRVDQLEAALEAAIVNLGAEVGRLEKVA